MEQKLRKQSTESGRLLVKKLSDKACLPKRQTSGAAGYDLYSAQELIIPSRQHKLVGTDLMIQVPDGTYGRIAPRSGLCLKYGIDVGAGVIDSDYRGTVGVILFNHSDQDFSIKIGDRIAQLILERISTPEVMEVDSLENSSRGEGGFGSTGQ